MDRATVDGGLRLRHRQGHAGVICEICGPERSACGSRVEHQTRTRRTHRERLVPEHHGAVLGAAPRAEFQALEQRPEFVFIDAPPAVIYTLSLHDALPI